MAPFIFIGGSPAPVGNKLFATGANGQGELGQGNTTARSSPVQVGTAVDWANVGDCPGLTAMAFKTDGTMWIWGNGSAGQLANGTTTPNLSSPVQVGAGTDWANGIISGTSFGIKANGNLYGWGANGSGQRGDGTLTNTSSPVLVDSGNWSCIASGSLWSAGIKSGALYTTGNNASGQLGQNNLTSKSLWTQVGTATDWKKVIAGGTTWLAIKTNGTLWACGTNTNGQFGNLSTTGRSSPVQVGTRTDWADIAYDGTIGTVAAVDSSGRLYTWGAASNGSLGNGTTTPALSSPVQIGTLTNWKNVYGGSMFHAIKTDGTLWGWGPNNGAIGDNSTSTRLSPVQVGTLATYIKSSGPSSFSLQLRT